jgi:hypothetical protein
VAIGKINVTKVMSVMPSPPPAGFDGLRLNFRGLMWNPGMSTGLGVRLVIMRVRMRRKKHRKLIIDQCRMWRTEGIVGLTWEPVMLTDMWARIATMQMQMRRKAHRNLMTHQHRMWRPEGIVLESVKIRQYISDQ